MRRIACIILCGLVSLTISAQHHHGRGPQEGRGPHHHIECATGEQLNMAMQVLENQSFDDKRLEVAELCVVLGRFCTEDLARMARVFSFDDNRTKFLTFAYRYCQDPQNYYRLREVFEFESNFRTMMDAVMPGYDRRP